MFGGKDSNFRMGTGARFYFQHDAQMLAGERVSLFDDEAGPPFYASTSRGLVLALSNANRPARARVSLHTKLALAESEGSVQTLGNGDAFVGFGSTPFFAEFSAVGALRYEATLPVDAGSYREYVFPWSATPPTKPLAAARRLSATESTCSRAGTARPRCSAGRCSRAVAGRHDAGNARGTAGVRDRDPDQHAGQSSACASRRRPQGARDLGDGDGLGAA